MVDGKAVGLVTRLCSVCAHRERGQIDQGLIESRSYRDVARQFGLSKDAVARHHRSHLPSALVKAQAAAEEVQSGTLLNRLRGLNSETASVLTEAKRAKNQDLRLKALARMEKQIELEGAMLGQLQQQGVAVEVNVAASAQQVVADPTTPEFHRAVLDTVGRLVNLLPAHQHAEIAAVLLQHWEERRAAKLREAEAKRQHIFPPGVIIANTPQEGP